MKVFSGIRPSGQLHIGNYLGAMRQWIKLQEIHDCIFCIVDLHAITTPYEPEELQENIKEAASIYLAAGIDPKKSIFFVQSKIKEHSELAWLLGTIIPTGDLLRMTQYKEKSQELRESPKAGLLNYPILMAADILLYQAELVPVGKDQQQHVELAREIARKFNRKFGKTFKIPEVFLPKMGAKIMSLQNPGKKMAKSEGEESYIALLDSPETIKEKIMKAVTDPGKEIKYDSQKKPGISNLLTIYSLFSEKSLKEIEKEFKGKGYEDFKKSLTHLLIEKLEPFKTKQKELLKKEDYLQKILDEGAKKAKVLAQSTMKEVSQKMGLI